MINLKGRIMEIFNNLYENLYFNLVELFNIYIYTVVFWKVLQSDSRDRSRASKFTGFAGCAL